MYKILCDGIVIVDPSNEELAAINPVVNIELNNAGSFSFVLPLNHPFYNTIKRRSSYIEIYQDDVLLIAGQAVEEKINFKKDKTINGEGELSYLNDSIQRPARYQNQTVRQYLTTLVENHNSQVDDSKKFTVGIVTVSDPNDSLFRFTNYNNTLQEINDDLVKDLGGYLFVRHSNGVRYLDYLEDFTNTCDQSIEFGENLLDYASNIDTSEIATAIIPLGARLEEQEVEGLEKRLDIKSVNDGLDYVFNQDAVNAYGWIFKTVTWDGVTVASNLKSKGLQYLSEIQFDEMILNIDAVDLHLVDETIDQFKLGDYIRVISKPHGLDKLFLLSKVSYDLNNPSNFKITLGKTVKSTISSKSAQANENIKKAVDMITPASSILKDAKENATQLLINAMGGYIYKTRNELFIMDSENPETAQKVWRWNINGFGYSSTGINGEYGLAMTMDGSIVADFIKSGSINADLITSGKLNCNLLNGGTIHGQVITNLVQNAWMTIEGASIQGGYNNEPTNTIDFSNRTGGVSTLGIIGDNGVRISAPHFYIDDLSNPFSTNETVKNDGFWYVRNIEFQNFTIQTESATYTIPLVSRVDYGRVEIRQGCVTSRYDG